MSRYNAEHVAQLHEANTRADRLAAQVDRVRAVSASLAEMVSDLDRSDEVAVTMRAAVARITDALDGTGADQ